MTINYFIGTALAITPHQQADVLREEGKTLEALNLYN